MRTTYLMVTMHGPQKPMFDGDKPGSITKCKGLRGHWRVESLQRYAKRKGVEVLSAHSIVRDHAKGGVFPSSYKTIIQKGERK